MTALADREASQYIELDEARIDNFEDVEVSSMSEDSDDERSRSKSTKSMSARASSSILPRRNFLSARFQHNPTVPRSSPPPPSPKPSQSPAGQAPHVEQAANIGHPPDNPYPLSSDSSLWHALSRDWVLEQTFLLIATMSLMAIVLILFLYNGHPVLDLPRVITVNAILAIFSTSLTAALSVPLAISISQAKWNWFLDDQGGGKPLSELEIYDQASRGPWGALVMLGKIGWRHFSSLGALIVVLTLATDCIIQQTISYELRLVASPRHAPSKPGLPISLGYNDTGNTELQEAMAKAISYAFLGIPPASFLAAASCPSGECTWQAYDTLAVCSFCKNVTAKDPEGGTMTPCHVANGHEALNNSITSSLYTAPSLLMNRFFKEHFCYYDCSLSWCVQSLSSATSIGGVFMEKSRNPSNLTDIKNGRIRIVSDGMSSSSSSSSSIQSPTGGNNELNFTVDESSNYRLGDYVRQALSDRIGILTNGNKNNFILAEPTLLFKNIAKAISAQLRTVPFSSSSSSSSPASSNSPPNTTTTTTTTLLAPNTAFYREPVLVALWVWLAFPVFLLFATAFFLFLVIFTARNPVWKDSLWPLCLWAGRPRQGAAMIWRGQSQGPGRGQAQGQQAQDQKAQDQQAQGQQAQAQQAQAQQVQGQQAQGQGWGYGLEDMKRVAGVRIRLQRDGRGGWGFTLGRQDGGGGGGV